METTGDRIRKIREARGLTLDQVAERSGVSKGFLSDAENNKRNVSSQYLLKIANTLNASLEYLLRGTEAHAARTEPTVVPAELTEAAERLDLSAKEMLALLRTREAFVAKRAAEGIRVLSAQEWTELYHAIRRFST